MSLTSIAGALLAIPTNVFPTLNQSLATAPARALLWTLTYYGGYLVDDTYHNRGTICLEHGATDEFLAAWGYDFNARVNTSNPFYDDMLHLFQALQIVVNNSPKTIGGGGAELQPPPPPFCD